LGVRQGDRVKIEAEGEDAPEALDAILMTLPGEVVSLSHPRR
jgi:phosphotransferase system HPr-like phosphotransfer protein